MTETTQTSAKGAAIVTGSSSGIGQAIAVRLAEDGFPIVLADIQTDPIAGGETTEKLILDGGGSCTYVHCDVGNSNDCETLIDRVLETYGNVGVLVNNARVAGRHSQSLLDTTNENFDAMMAANVRGPFILIRRCVREMLQQEPKAGVRGRIINIGSIHGMVGVPQHFTYAVNKGALNHMTRQVALEHGRDGILSNGVLPGKIETGSPDDKEESDVVGQHVRNRTPFFRLGRPEDIAAAVSFVASDGATFMSGTNLIVDGGVIAS